MGNKQLLRQVTGYLRSHHRLSVINYVLTILLIISNLVQVSSANPAADFFANKNKYQGFYWFQEQEAIEAGKEAAAKTAVSLSPEAAAANIEARKAKLDNARSVMLELALSGADKQQLYQAIKEYREQEQHLFNAGEQLAHAWEVVNFLSPELVDLASNPNNVPANKLKRKTAEQEAAKQIVNFAQNYDLVVFEQENCPYCQEFKPIIKRFALRYGFNLDFARNNEQTQQLISQLQITAAPTLVAVAKDATSAFELARGLVTKEELSENIVIATELIASEYQFGKKITNNNSISRIRGNRYGSQDSN